MPFAHSEPMARTEISVKTAPTTRTIETLVAKNEKGLYLFDKSET